MNNVDGEPRSLLGQETGRPTWLQKGGRKSDLEKGLCHDRVSLCEAFLPIRFPISASFTNWLPSGCIYCHDGLPGVRAMLYTYIVFVVLFSLRLIFLFSFTFLIFSVIFLTSSL